LNLVIIAWDLAFALGALEGMPNYQQKQDWSGNSAFGTHLTAGIVCHQPHPGDYQKIPLTDTKDPVFTVQLEARLDFSPGCENSRR
jgi:hypothetical protein